MSFHNRVAMFLAVIFVLLVIFVGLNRVALTSGQFQKQYAPSLTQPH